MVSNLPPGCRVSDIPGNRPEDLAAEAKYDTIYDELEKLGYDCNEKSTEQLAEAISKLMDEAFAAGYSGNDDKKQQLHNLKYSLDYLMQQAFDFGHGEGDYDRQMAEEYTRWRAGELD